MYGIRSAASTYGPVSGTAHTSESYTRWYIILYTFGQLSKVDDSSKYDQHIVRYYMGMWVLYKMYAGILGNDESAHTFGNEFNCERERTGRS